MNTKTFIYVFILAGNLITALTFGSPALEEAYLTIAQVLQTEGNLTQAVENYEKVLSVNPCNSIAQLKLGLIFYQNGATDKAISHLEKHLQQVATSLDAALHLGACHAIKGDLEKAISYYHHALSLSPRSPRTHLCLAIAYEKQHNVTKALESYTRALMIDPDFLEAHIRIANIYATTNSLEQTLNHLNEALRLAPTNAKIMLEKANTLHKLANFDAAQLLYQQILTLHPNTHEALYNIGYTLRRQGKFQDALPMYQQIIMHDPNNIDAHIGLAHIYLVLGNFEQGWQEFELRTSTTLDKQLTNLEEIPNATIFIKAEWGDADLIHFVRYAKLIKDLGGRIILQVPHQLVYLLARCPYIDHLVTIESGIIPPYDKVISLLSLPHLFKTTAQTIPAPIPYVYPSSELYLQWKTLLSSDHNFKIGLYWGQMPKYPTLDTKAVPFTALAPLARLHNTSFYCLQDSPNVAEFACLPPTTVVHHLWGCFAKGVDTYSHLAAVIANLDLIITTDSAIAHLAGAMGKTTCLMMQYTPEWRWMVDRSDSPWYPSMRIFRQTTPGNWQSVVTAIFNAIQTSFAQTK